MILPLLLVLSAMAAEMQKSYRSSDPHWHDSSYQYNGLCDRVRDTNTGITYNFTLDLNTRLAQVLANGTNTYLYGSARIGRFTASDSAYILGYALGSVRQWPMGKSYKPISPMGRCCSAKGYREG